MAHALPASPPSPSSPPPPALSPPAAVGRWRARLGVPDLTGQRRVVAATVLDAFGVGMFVPLSFLFFVLTTELSVAQVGLGSSLATLLSLPVAPLAGALVDRWGARTSLVVNNLLVAGGYLGYLLVDSLPGLVAAMLVVLSAERLYFTAWPGFVADLAEGAELDRWYAFTTAGGNAAAGLGGAAGGLLLGTGWPGAAVAVVVVNAATSLAAAALLLTPGARPSDPARRKGGPTGEDAAGSVPGWGALLRERRLLGLLAAQAALGFGWLVPTVVLPVYLVEVAGLPAWVPSAALTLNAVVIVVAQSATTARLVVFSRTRVVGWASALMVGSIALLAVGGGRVGSVAGAVLLFTAGQVLAGPACTAIAATAAPVGARGRFLALVNLAWAVSAVGGPLMVGALIERHGALFWSLLGSLVAAGGIGFRAAGRRTVRTGPAGTGFGVGPGERCPGPDGAGSSGPGHRRGGQ
ncbi:MFS transporter [Kitasatospora phosalacinea]|uniref:MFS transporter n=1 Tax=Kitasatospora phosalacinea TaxID=2065 RepID=A0A9W6V5S9_9ACTN|nr:MFS transporter [Kitasatospora phosalacinea]GLW74598.1 MFS transporter [Kitasatospora phosalacinea]